MCQHENSDLALISEVVCKVPDTGHFEFSYFRGKLENSRLGKFGVVIKLLKKVKMYADVSISEFLDSNMGKICKPRVVRTQKK